MILGVCGGLADYFNMDVSVVRLIAVALMFLGIGSPILVYLVMGVVLPEETTYIR